jgi:hypothetical protein
MRQTSQAGLYRTVVRLPANWLLKILSDPALLCSVSQVEHQPVIPFILNHPKFPALYTSETHAKSICESLLGHPELIAQTPNLIAGHQIMRAPISVCQEAHVLGHCAALKGNVTARIAG